LQALSQSALHRRTDKTSFFLTADNFEFDSRLAADSLHQAAVIPGFARSRRSHGTIGRDVVPVHAATKLAKSSGGSCDCFFVEQATRESIVPQANSGSFAVEDLNMIGRSCASNRQSNGIRASVDRSQLDRSSHS
jgi:hypothetical protein